MREAAPAAVRAPVVVSRPLSSLTCRGDTGQRLGVADHDSGFNEAAVLAELEALQRAIEASRQQRREKMGEFEAFVRSKDGERREVTDEVNWQADERFPGEATRKGRWSTRWTSLQGDRFAVTAELGGLRATADIEIIVVEGD